MIENKNTCQEILGWRVVKTEDVSLPKSSLTELEHIKTGARYIHLANDSKENVFAVALKTVPTSSNGVAHILEHTVLTGSEKYPVRDPFFSMVKRSLQTFMNAFTSCDWTAYPFASPNKKDFYNLMSVYLDAVFFPKISELNFLQEGWRYVINYDAIKIEGVVYNEMKGSLSSPARRMEEALLSSTYSEAPYHYNTGGEPAIISSLSHEELIAFHKKFYHPSNAYFYSYGNLPLLDNLKMINENVLDRFNKSEVAVIKAEKRWDEPRQETHFYPISDSSDVNKNQVALSWLSCKSQDNLEVFSLEILEDILIGNPASPVRKALLDSGLGSDLCDSAGYESESLDTKFVLGLKDVGEQNIEKTQDLILKTLESLVKNKIDTDLIEAVVSSNETRKRNISNSPYPYGLQVFLDLIAPWVHGGEASEVLQFEELLKKLKDKIASGNYFESLIQKYFLDNNHRVLVVLAPDKNMQDRLNAEESLRNEKVLSKLDEGALTEINNNTDKLKKLQEAKEDLSCLPSLELSDIDKSIDETKEDSDSSQNLLCYSKNTYELLHFVGSFDLSRLDEKLLGVVPFFSYLLTRMGTKKMDYEKLANKIDNLTGGISVSPQALKYFGDKTALETITMSTYSLRRNNIAMLDLIKEIIQEFDFSDLARVKMLLKTLYSRYQSVVVDQGHNFAATAAMSVFSRSNFLSESWQGLEQANCLKQLNKNFEQDNGNSLVTSLNELGSYFRNEALNSIALIGDKDDILESRQSAVKLLVDKQNQGNKHKRLDNLRSAFETSTAVSFVAAACEMPDIRHEDAAALMVASKLLSRGFIHNEIREKRGAYGGFARYDYLDGTWWFGSYRDPHIVSTLNVFASAKNYLINNDWSKSEVEEAIIAVSSDISRPSTEQESAKKAYLRKITNLSDEDRRLFKERLLAVRKEDLSRVGEVYLKDNWHDYSVAVISSKEKIEAANRELGEFGLGVVSI